MQFMEPYLFLSIFFQREVIEKVIKKIKKKKMWK